jgi:hypothetical protein
MCEKLGCLPDIGGLLDQDYITIRRLEIVYSVDQTLFDEEQDKRDKRGK